MTKKCTCGHPVSEHIGIYDNIWIKRLQTTRDACMHGDKLYHGEFDWCQCRTFQLDNLSYIEDLAKHRNLI
jgi:hypothetical protein